MRVTPLDEVLERHRVPLFDAYGVLVDASGARRGAVERIAGLRAQKRPFFVLTNDGSRLPDTCEARYRSLGLDIGRDDIISTAGLLAGYYAQHALAGARTMMLGPGDARRAVLEGQGVIIPTAPDAALDVLVIADEAFQPFMQQCDDALSALVRSIDAGRTPRLVLLNPDLIYPRGASGFGFTAGSVAAMFEGALRIRYRQSAPSFARLGKPFAAPYEEAVRRAGTRDLVMIGDQLDTDIAGAKRFGIASALILGGVGSDPRELELADHEHPDYLLDAL